MGLFTPGRRAKHRKFSYEPRFYNPEKEEKLKRRMRIQSKVRRKDPAGLIYFLLLAGLAIWMYLTL